MLRAAVNGHVTCSLSLPPAETLSSALAPASHFYAWDRAARERLVGEFPEASVRLANGTAVDGSRGGKMARSGALIGYDVRTTGGAWKDKTEPRGAVTVEKKERRRGK